MEKEYKLGSIVVMKKEHPCGTNEWEITRIGADIKKLLDEGLKNQEIADRLNITVRQVQRLKKEI